MDSYSVKKWLKADGVFVEGLSAAWPICVGYFPIGLAFGVLAQKAGLSPAAIGMMSLLVFAGSSQFIAVAMLSNGVAIASIIATTFMVNLRHLLMSSALSVYLGDSSKRMLPLFAYGVTDESFAVNLGKFTSDRWDLKRSLVVNHISNIVWIGSTVIGGYGGQFVPARAFGIDYALIAMFICLLVFQLNGKKYIIIAILSGVLAVVFSLILPGSAYIVLASISASTIGVIVKKWTR